MTPTPADYFGHQVRATRKRKGWTQDNLATRLAELGEPMHPTAITKIEKGNRTVSISEAIAIAAALDVSPLALLLPRDKGTAVAITPAATGFDGEAVRSWFDGSLPITASLMRERDDGTHGWHTIDGRPLSDAEHDERRRFYEAEVSTDQWRIGQIPGLAQLAQQMRAYERARVSDDDPVILRSHLAQMTAEIERQYAEIDRMDKGGD